MLRSIDGPALDYSFLFQDAQVGELVFHFVERAKHGGFVSGGLRFVAMARLVGEGVAAAGVKKQLGGLRAEGPESAGTLNPGSTLAAFEAASAAERDGGVIGADGDADLGVCGGNAALRGGDVRTALNQLRGDAEWNAGQPEIERGGLKSEFAGLLPH